MRIEVRVPVTSTVETMDRAIVITGAPGAGKSTVLEAFTSLLDNDRVPFAAFETEQLAHGYPWLDEETTYEVVAVVVEALKVRGRSLFVVTATTETDAHIDALRTALAADETTIVCVTASPDTTSRRVFEREPAEWLGRDDLVAHSAVLARQIPALRGIDLHVSNEGRDIREVAAEIRAKTL
jgi:energy-coupling factor transporter ATP-binding protein EcfA2